MMECEFQHLKINLLKINQLSLTQSIAERCYLKIYSKTLDWHQCKNLFDCNQFSVKQAAKLFRIAPFWWTYESTSNEMQFVSFLDFHRVQLTLKTSIFISKILCVTISNIWLRIFILAFEKLDITIFQWENLGILQIEMKTDSSW